MSIVVKCPHCETKFNLQPDMVGKSMRCPEPRMPPGLHGQAAAEGDRTAADARTDPVADSAAAPSRANPKPKPTKAEKPRPATASRGGRCRDRRGRGRRAAEGEGSRLVGRDRRAAANGKKPVRPEVLDDTDDQPILRRKKKKSRGPWILIGMSVG